MESRGGRDAPRVLTRYATRQTEGETGREPQRDPPGRPAHGYRPRRRCEEDDRSRGEQQCGDEIRNREPPASLAGEHGVGGREDAERQLITKVLGMVGDNLSRAAELLGVTRPTLYALLDKYKMRPEKQNGESASRADRL